jgi:hypothetical protein
MQPRPTICVHCGAEQTAAPLAPWEKSLPPVPYTDATSPLSTTEREALPSLWAAKENDAANIGRPVDSPQPSVASSFSQTTPRHRQMSSWSPVIRTSQDISTRGPPLIDTSVLPERPSRSLAASPDRATVGLFSIDETSQNRALPGTMSSSALERRHSRRRPRSLDRDDTRERQRAISKRLRTSLVELFKKHPVDESMLEHIDHHHWAEDD